MKNHSKSTTIRRRSVSIFLFVALLFGYAAAAGAQYKTGSWEIGFGTGAVDLDGKIEDDSDVRFEFRGGYFLTDHFEIEGQVGRSGTGLSPTVDTVFANGVYNFRTDQAVVPYVLAGIGHVRVDDAELNLGSITIGGREDDSFAYQAGIGSRFFFGDQRRVAARLELASFVEETFDESTDHLNLTAGVSWKLGR